MLFCEANQNQLVYMSWTLMWFEAIINLSKSEIIPVGRVDNVEEMAFEFGCEVGCLLSRIWVCLEAPHN